MKLPAPPPRRDRVLYAAAAVVLSYPDDETLGRLPLVEAALVEAGALAPFEPVLAHLRSMAPMEAQAWHVQEFDLSRRHAMHLTYWTDGDTRRRGEVLAAIKQTYRDSGLVANLFDERDPAVKMLLAMAISAANKAGKYIGICGQGPSDHPDLAEWLMDQGISSISLNPDTVVDTWTRLASHKKA